MGHPIRYMLAAVVSAWLVGGGVTAGPVNKERFPGADDWGDVRVSAERMPAAEFVVAPAGKQLAFFGYNHAFHLFDLASFTVKRTVRMDTSARDLAYSPDGKSLITAEWFGGVKLRDARTGQVLLTFAPDKDLGAFYAAFVGEGKLTAYCWRSKAGAGSPMTEQLALWDLPAEKRIGWPSTERVEKGGDMIRRSFIGAGRLLLSIETKSEKGRVVARSVTLTDPNTNKVSPKVVLDAADDFIFDVDPEGKTLLVFNRDEPPRLVDVATGKSGVSFKGHTQFVTCGAFSADGKLIATASGTTRRTMLGPKAPPRATDPTEIIIWEAATGKQVASLRDMKTTHDYHKVAFSADGKLVIAMTRPESPVPKKERKGGTLVLWGKLPK